MTVLVVTLLCSQVGTPAQCQGGDPTLCAVPVSKGQPAPYDGELLTAPLALQIKQEARHCEATLMAQQDAASRDIALTRETADRLRDDDAAAYKTSMEKCSKTLSEQQALVDRCEPPFWQKPWFVAPLVAILSASATAYLVASVR